MLTPFDATASHMDCDGAPLCGVLVLETGLGRGAYSHDAPRLHGLWPETGKYGSSNCVAPKQIQAPERLLACYNDIDVGVQR